MPEERKGQSPEAGQQVPAQPSQPAQPAGQQPVNPSSPAFVPPSGQPQPGQQPPSAGAPMSDPCGGGQQPPSQPPYQAHPQQTWLSSEPGQAPYRQPGMGMPPVKNHETSSLVLGVLSIVFGFISPLVAWILGGIGLNFASKDRKNFGPNASRAGRNCSIAGIIIGLIMWLATVALLISSGDSVMPITTSTSTSIF
ncbi:MAG: hypothetical protein Q4F23_03850 [Coriobacteriia bacterium]|nr:hypothetical protein [Coriobacteriia bacterium]